MDREGKMVMAGERLIFHIDVNSAFLSWEAVERLKHPEQFPEITVDLRDIPSAVGGIGQSVTGSYWQNPFRQKNIKYRRENPSRTRSGNVPTWCWFRRATGYTGNIHRHFCRFWRGIQM